MDTLTQKLYDQSFMSKHGGKVAVGTAVFLGSSELLTLGVKKPDFTVFFLTFGCR